MRFDVCWASITVALANHQPAHCRSRREFEQPGKARRLRITLKRDGTRTPVLTGLSESFDQTGTDEATARRLIRTNSPNDGVMHALVMDRTGKITFEYDENPAPSSAGRCLLAFINCNDGGGTAQFYVRYLNMRRPVEKISGTQPASPQSIGPSLAVPVRYFEVNGIVLGTNHIYRPSGSFGVIVGVGW